MWSFRFQKYFRWASLWIFLAALGLTAYMTGSSDPVLFSQTGLKIRMTELSIKAEALGSFWWLGGLLSAWFLLFVGVPSIVLIPVLILLTHPFKAFLVLVVHQTLVTAAIWTVSRRFGIQDPEGNDLRPLIANLGTGSLELAFWPRLFNLFPLRSLDLMTLSGIPTGRSIIPALIAAGCGNAIRTALNIGWFYYFFAVIVNCRPFPAQDLGWFLALTAGQILSHLFPKIPELIPTPKGVGKIVNSLAGPL